MTQETKTPPQLKPWRNRVRRRHVAKWLKRKHWSKARWQRHHDEREEKRNQPRRRYLKRLREEAQAIENYRSHFRELAALRRRDRRGRFLP